MMKEWVLKFMQKKFRKKNNKKEVLDSQKMLLAMLAVMLRRALAEVVKVLGRENVLLLRRELVVELDVVALQEEGLLLINNMVMYTVSHAQPRGHAVFCSIPPGPKLVHPQQC